MVRKVTKRLIAAGGKGISGRKRRAAPHRAIEKVKMINEKCKLKTSASGRSGTSLAPNYSEACAAESKCGFIRNLARSRSSASLGRGSS